MKALISLSAVLTLSLLAGGCANISPGNVAAIQPISDASSQRAGNAYLFRGFIGVFSTGMNSLGEQLSDQGVRTMVFQADQWEDVAGSIEAKYKAAPNVEPVVLVGHSYGADNILKIAQKLNEKNVKVDLIITLDPVTPPKVTPNVVKVVNIYQSNGVMDTMPWLRGIPLEEETPGSVTLLNEDIRVNRTELLGDGVNHFNIEKKPKIHGEIIKQVLAVCVTKQAWAAKATNELPGAPAQAAIELPSPASESLTSSGTPMREASANAARH
ncbi:MAG TPA: hypothetical protein VGB55_13460 [Tepidisphaeraceae bacterium]|jgi:hypothetical protein